VSLSCGSWQDGRSPTRLSLAGRTDAKTAPYQRRRLRQARILTAHTIAVAAVIVELATGYALIGPALSPSTMARKPHDGERSRRQRNRRSQLGDSEEFCLPDRQVRR
jgi:hypothetical protein